MQLVDQDVPGPRRNFVGYGRHQPKVVWPNEAKVAVNLVVNYEEGSEYSKPAGDGRNEGLAEIPYTMDAQYRDLCAESVYEYGSRAGIWRLMRLFDEYQVKVTFFACAVAMERNPEVGRMAPGVRSRAVLARLALERALGFRPGAGAPAHAVGDRDDRAHMRRAAARLVLPLRPEREHARAASSRKAASSTTPTPTTTTSRTSPR